MEKPARISLSGNSNGEEESISLFTVGKVVFEPAITSIEYEEVNEDGDKLKTCICISGGIVTVNKFSDELVTTMVFEEGQVSASSLLTPYGTIETEIKAETVTVEESAKEIRIVLVYCICLESGDPIHESRLTIECIFE